MRTHLKIVGAIHIAWNFLAVASAVFAIVVYFAGASALGIVVGQEGETTIATGLFAALAGFGAIIGCMALVPSLPGFLAGFGVIAQRSWARWTLVVISVIYLFGPAFPIGIYTLWVLLNDKSDFLFKSGLPATA